MSPNRPSPLYSPGAPLLAALLCCLGAVWCVPARGEARQEPAGTEEVRPPPPTSGIEFHCPAPRLPQVRRDMARFLGELEIPADLYAVFQDDSGQRLRYTLTTPLADSATLDFHGRPEFAIGPHVSRLPTAGGGYRQVATVSPKEIVLALMQHGRLTVFSGRACDVQALRDHVGIRQNTVAWAEVLHWGWPEGTPSQWNPKYWRAGAPRRGRPLWQAVNDAFFHQGKYEIGCYAAARLVMVQGILDYYRRIKQDDARVHLIEARLLQDRRPLADLEPGAMWSFETDLDPKEMERPGKILRTTDGIAPKNFVPGDWSYVLNTDPVTYEKTGYEGSNPIYLGRNRFVDYYNDNGHYYTFEEKLDDVYQWRHRVFNRGRASDRARIQPLSGEDYERLSRPPAAGGMLQPLRTTPYYFGFEELPDMKP